MLIALHWKTKHPVGLEHIFQDSGIESVEDSHHFSVQIKYVHQYTSMTYKILTDMKWLSSCCMSPVVPMVQPEKCYILLNILCACANLYAQQDLDRKQCIIDESV